MATKSENLGQIIQTYNTNDINNNYQNEKDYKLEIVWRNVIGMTALHFAGFYGFYLLLVGFGNWKIFAYVWFVNILAGLSILAGAHRLWAHRSYKAKWQLRVILAIFQTIAMQNDIYEWCRDHRVHHKYSETDADPHNSKRGFFFAHMGWLLCKKHPDVKEKGKIVDMSDLWSDPIVRFQRRFYIPLVILFRGFIMTGIPVYLSGETLVHGLSCNAFCYVLTLHHTWLVNSAAHLYGHKPYDVHINPRESISVVYASMGEGYHNYHHTFPWDYSASELSWKYNFNPATAFIDFCAKIGWAYDRKKPSEEMVKKRIQRTGDKYFLESKRFKINYWLDLYFGIIVTFWPFLVVYPIRMIYEIYLYLH